MNPRGVYLRNWLQVAGFDPFDDEKPADAPMVEKRWESLATTYRALHDPNLNSALTETILQLGRTFGSRIHQFALWCGVDGEFLIEQLEAALV